MLTILYVASPVPDYRLTGADEKLLPEDRVVLIMGFLQPKESWAPIIDLLLAKYTGRGTRNVRVLAFDNRGVGGSSAPWWRYTTSQMAQDALALMDHVGWDAASIFEADPRSSGPLRKSTFSKDPVEAVTNLLELLYPLDSLRANCMDFTFSGTGTYLFCPVAQPAILEVEFTGSDSAARVQRLQALCGRPATTPPDKQFDALLLIGGVDSFHSALSQAALKFLFLGACGQELLGEQVISQQHERLEDVVLLLTAQRAIIFYSSEGDAAAKILPMISRWRTVQEVTVHDAMDLDEQEARKIRALRDMVAGIERIGIPYGVDPHDAGRDLEDPMVPEKWPLIQSYALETQESGGGSGSGFFTMNHQVVNASCRLRDVLAALDAFSAKRALQESAPLLQHHFDQFLMKLDHAESPEARDARSETEIGEDLLSFFEFGTMQFAARGLEPLPSRGSRVLFGKRTGNLALSSSNTAHLKDAGGARGRAATHMLVQGEDPFSGVRFARTYFLSTGKTCSRVVDEDALVHAPLPARDPSGSSSDTDTRLLIDLYALLLRGFRTARRSLLTHILAVERHEMRDGPLELKRAVAEAKAAVIRAMLEHSEAQSQVVHENDMSAAFLEENLALGVECLDARGLQTAFRAQEMSHMYMSMTLSVASSIEPSESLGALVVGDSFLVKPATPSTPHSESGDAFVRVTKGFPYFRSWVQRGVEAECVRAFVATLRSAFMLQSPALQLGQAVATMDALADAASASSRDQDRGSEATAQVVLTKATLLLDCDELPLVQGSMRLFSGGFVFLSPHMNPVIVSFAKSVSGLQVMTTPFDELVLLHIDLKPDPHTRATPLSAALPFSSALRELFVPLVSGTRFQEEILHVLATWRRATTALDIPFFRPTELGHAFEGDTPRDGKALCDELPPAVRMACADLVKRQRAASLEGVQIADAFLPQLFIPKAASSITTLGKPSHDLSKLCVPVTVMLGIPGSDVARVAQSICDFSSGANDWVHVSIDMREAAFEKQDVHYERYTHARIQLELCKSLEFVKANVNPRVHPRIMLSVVGYVDPITVAAAVKSVALSGPPLQVKLSLLAACVTATNVYLPDPLEAQSPFPKLFDQMTSGFATHIVVTHTSDLSSSQLGRLRFRIDQVNPFADIHVLSQDVFEGPITALLAVDRFESAYYMLPKSMRFAIAPGMERSRFLHLVGSTLTPFAAFSKSIEKLHQRPPESKQPSKGIRIAQSLATDKPEGADQYGGSCWNVEARVVFASDLAVVYRYVSTGTNARMRVEKQLVEPDEVEERGGGEAVAPSLELMVTGINLDANKIRELLLRCYAKTERCVAPLRAKNCVSLAEKREIQKAHAADPLPEGYLFDGSNYVDFFGGRYEFHPNIAQFVDEHIAAVNESTKRANVKVEESRHAQQALVKQLF
ncbi:hypothetical protein PybrP1_007437 [[Pythium] brassicae (nom. inval.)]|nr:hypothetical protein PybrP1_007437 [[Pythium] brassicae (nom. inval.)]